jgi:hypothetical protein
MESILISVKKMLGIDKDNLEFDDEIIMHINSVFTILNQLGVGPAGGFFIEDDSAEWTDFIPDMTKLHAVKTYIFQKVRIIFDPTSLGSASLAAYERTIQEFEWRLNVAAESEAKNEN